MKICNLNSELKFINRIGATLSTQQRISLTQCCHKLEAEYSEYDTYCFWGRIEGIAKNYYIIEAVKFKGAVEFPCSKFFWSIDDFKFAEMPEPRWDYANSVSSMDDFFTGQHEKILIKTSDYNRFLGGMNVSKQKNFTQLDRLVLTIHMISKQCNVVPLGAYKMIPTHELVQNPEFRGLKVHESKQLDCFVHLRAPINQQKKILIQSDKALERNDFLDSIKDDQIKNCWSLQCDESGTEVTLRNLYWPGYVAYHRTNSNIFGGAYMGTGIAVNDLPFLL